MCSIRGVIFCVDFTVKLNIRESRECFFYLLRYFDMRENKLKNWEDYRLKEELKAIKSMIPPGIFTIIFMLLGIYTAVYTDNISLALWYVSMGIWCLSLMIALERTQGLKIEKMEILLQEICQIMKDCKQKQKEEQEKEKSDT